MFQIMRFNWPQYACGMVVVASASMWLISTAEKPGWLWFGILAATVLATGWCIASLGVSHWVYDRSDLYRWSWITSALTSAPLHWLNLHAGLDESSAAIRRLFPDSVGRTCDFHSPVEMSEASIRRARDCQRSGTPGERVDYTQLPFADRTFDAVFVLFAAHELRRAAAREVFFGEIRRVLKPGGTVLLAEHARDFANFAAFGPGFLHFQPAAEWRRLARLASMRVEKTFLKTPFVRIMLMRRPS
jgi:SAM-dependent methyltransferase